MAELFTTYDGSPSFWYHAFICVCIVVGLWHGYQAFRVMFDNDAEMLFRLFNYGVGVCLLTQLLLLRSTLKMRRWPSIFFMALSLVMFVREALLFELFVPVVGVALIVMIVISDRKKFY